jgi:hypothetical protein
MILRISVVLLAAVCGVMPVAAQPGPKAPVEGTSVQRVRFAPGGTVRIEHSYGYLTVEGWDEPEVELAVTKSTDKLYKPSQQPRAVLRADAVKVVAEEPSGSTLTISTYLPRGKGLVRTVLLLPKSKRGITTDCAVRVPRNTRLLVQHDTGYISVDGVVSDIEVLAHTGDMIVTLADRGSYAIDARTRLGNITSDFDGSSRLRLPLGRHFGLRPEAEPIHIRLRIGRGSITVKKGGPSGPFWKE